MEGKWKGHFSEIPTENWGSPFIPVGTNQTDVANHLPISRFLLGSTLSLHKFAPLAFLDLNRNGCGNSAVNR